MSPADIEQKLRSDIGNAGQRRTDRDGGYPNSRSPRVFQKFGSIPLLTFATVSPQKPTFRIQHYATALRQKRPFTQGPICTVRHNKRQKATRALHRMASCETVPLGPPEIPSRAHSVRVEVPV
jgi:hypothetical protein